MINFSWVRQVQKDEKNKAVAKAQGAPAPQAQDPVSSALSWVSGAAKTASDIGAKGIDTFFGGTKNLVETAALIPKELTLRNDLTSGKISKDEYNTKIKEAYDKQPFFKLETNKDGLLIQKQMSPGEFLGNIGKGGLDAGLEIAPMTKAANVSIQAGTKFPEVLPQLLKQGATYGGLTAANDTAQTGQVNPLNAGLAVGGSLASFPIVKGAQKLPAFIQSVLGNKADEAAKLADNAAPVAPAPSAPVSENPLTAARSAQIKTTKEDLASEVMLIQRRQKMGQELDKNDLKTLQLAKDMETATDQYAVAKSVRRQLEKKYAPVQKDLTNQLDALEKSGPVTTTKTEAELKAQQQQIKEGDAAVKAEWDAHVAARKADPYKVAAEAVTGGPTNQIEKALPVDQVPTQQGFSQLVDEATSPAAKAADEAARAVAPTPQPKSTEIVAKLPDQVPTKADANATPEDLLNQTRSAAAKQYQTASTKLDAEVAKLQTLKPNTSEYQASQKIIADLTSERTNAQGLMNKTAQAKSMDDLVSQHIDDAKGKANALDYLRTPEHVLEKLGLKEESKFLRASYENYQAQLPKEIDKISGWAKQIDSEENTHIFQFLDGKEIQLTPKEQQIATEVQGYLKDWAKRLGLPEDKQISSYITHIFEKDFINKEFDPDIARLIRDKIPGSVYNPFMQKRLGKMGYKEDLIQALDAYAKRAVRSENMNPALDKLESASRQLDDQSYGYVKNYLKRVNMQPTEPEKLLDNLVKSATGGKINMRPTARASRATRRAVFRATIGGNFGSPIRNLSQGSNTYAELGEKYTTIGYTKLAMGGKKAYDELKEVGIIGNDLVQDRVLSAAKNVTQTADKALYSMFSGAEYVNRGAAYFGAKAKAIANGASEGDAIETAKKVVRDTQFNYGAIDTPVALNTPLAKLFGQYMSYPVKQTEYLLTKAGQKDLAGLTRLTVGSLLFVYTIGKAVGMKPEEILPWNRFQQDGVVSGLTSPVMGVADSAKGRDKYGKDLNPLERAQNFGDKAFTTLFPAGAQIKKTFQGMGAAQSGGMTDAAGKSTYKITPDEATQAVLFGPTSTKSAKDYYNSKSGNGAKKKTTRKRSSTVQR